MATTNTSAGLAHDYIFDLQHRFDCAKNAYEEISAATKKASSTFSGFVVLNKKIGSYYEHGKATCELIDALDRFLAKFVSFLEDKFVKSLEKSEEAVEILVKSIKCLSYLVEDTRQQIRLLLELIDCLNNPVLSRDKGIMKCLVELQTKAGESVNANLDAIKKILELLKQTIGLSYLHYRRESRGIPGRVTVHMGLLADLRRLQQILQYTACNEQAPSLYDENIYCKDEEVEGEIPCSDKKPDADFTVIRPSKPNLCDEDNGYLAELSSLLAESKEHLEYSECLKEHYAEKEKQAKAARDAVEAALKAAKAVKDKCK